MVSYVQNCHGLLRDATLITGQVGSFVLLGWFRLAGGETISKGLLVEQWRKCRRKDGGKGLCHLRAFTLRVPRGY